MTIGVIHAFLRKMFPGRWPHDFSMKERRWIVSDTFEKEVKRYAPELLPHDERALVEKASSEGGTGSGFLGL